MLMVVRVILAVVVHGIAMALPYAMVMYYHGIAVGDHGILSRTTMPCPWCL